MSIYGNSSYYPNHCPAISLEDLQQIKKINAMTPENLTNLLGGRDSKLNHYSNVHLLNRRKIKEFEACIQNDIHENIQAFISEEVAQLKKELKRLNKIHKNDYSYIKNSIFLIKKIKESTEGMCENYDKELNGLSSIKRGLVNQLDNPLQGLNIQYKKITQFIIYFRGINLFIKELEKDIKELKSNKENRDTSSWSKSLELPNLFSEKKVTFCPTPEQDLEEIRSNLKVLYFFYKGVECLLHSHEDYFHRAIVNYHQLRLTVEVLEKFLTF